MIRISTLALFTLVGVTLAQQAASSRMMIAQFTLTQKVAQADAVLVGKVTEIEKDDVEVLPYAGATEKMIMKVAAVKIETSVMGVKTVTHVKVLFQPPVAVPADIPPPAGVVRPAIIRRGGVTPITLKEGDEALYFLTKHPTAANYYHIPASFAPVSAKAETFKSDLAKVTSLAAMLADPMKAFKAEKAEDRLAAAALLVQKYRRGSNVPTKEVAIPAEETKAILKALADADWTAADKPTPGFDYTTAPTSIANQIGLFPGSPKGVPQFQPKAGESYNAKYQEVYKAWYEKNADKFEIKKFVPIEK